MAFRIHGAGYEFEIIIVRVEGCEMEKKPASIFNDVIGPVMRGPSSSHSAASVRIGKLARQMAVGDVDQVFVEFDSKGALAATYHGHGSDFGFAGGLLGYDPEDERLVSSLKDAQARGIDIVFRIADFEADHPNTYRITIKTRTGKTVRTTAISTGGGMVEITEIAGLPVHICGDFHETILLLPAIDNDRLKSILNEIDQALTLEQLTHHIICDNIIQTHHVVGDNVIQTHHVVGDNVIQTHHVISDPACLVNVKSEGKIPEDLLRSWAAAFQAHSTMQLIPVLPVMSRFDSQIPFHTAKEMLEVGIRDQLQTWELAILYESRISGVSRRDVLDRMEKIAELMANSIDEGLQGTVFKNRILGSQSMLISKADKEGKLIPGNVMNSSIACISAMMETKSSMGVIVAAPTAGSCGVLPGTIIGTARAMGLASEDVAKALLAAGIVGVFIASKSGFAAEVGGCQLECGAASGMTAAALVQLLNGSPEQGVDAASMAIQNTLGMICDPVGNRVEVPCLGKNIMAGMNALACANMALAGYDKVIPLDEALDALQKVGSMLPQELRCTCMGGLSLTETSARIEKRLDEMNEQ